MTGATDVTGWICGSPSHEYEYCAPAWAGRHLDHLNKVFRWYPLIWFADIEYDSALLNRMDQRRHDHGAGSVVIRRHRGTVPGECARFHIFTDKALPGRLEPKTWEPLTPDEAIDRLANSSLFLPGLFSRKGLTPITYSKSWRIDQGSSKGAGGSSGDPSTTETLGFARSRRIFSEAQALVAVKARQLLGEEVLPLAVRVTWTAMPVEWRPWWVEQIQEAVKHLASNRNDQGNLSANALQPQLFALRGRS